VSWNAAEVPQSPRHRMRKQARRTDARNWIRSGATVSIRTYRKRYGVDGYTAYDDLHALGVPLTPGDEQWAVRPGIVPKRREEPDMDDEWRVVDQLPRPPSHATRKRAARKARHDAARDWIRSGAKKLNVRTYARRFGVDRYKAYADLRAIGFPLDAEAERWAVRPPKAPKRRLPQYEPNDEWIIVGDQRMFVVGYTAAGAPYGYVEDIETDEPSYDGEPF
jgi:predicted DNA-binding transcriptional regulator YafY